MAGRFRSVLRTAAGLLRWKSAAAEDHDLTVGNNIKGVTIKSELAAMAVVAKAISTGEDPDFSKACSMEPEKFWPDINFYLVKCRHSVKDVKLVMDGEDLWMDGNKVDNSIIDIDIPHAEDPQIKEVYACPTGKDFKDSGCFKYNFDIFRMGSDIASLGQLGVSSTKLMNLEPEFDSTISEYHAQVEMFSPFSISAGAAQFKSRVGIKAPPGSGLPASQNGCHVGTKRQTVWNFPGFNATGEYKFVLCALATDNVHMTEYTLKVQVTPKYSVKLQGIDAGDFELKPAFDPEITSYTIEIAAEDMKIDIGLHPLDPEAKIHISGTGKDDEKPTRGSTKTAVYMHDNKHRGNGEPPQWSRDVQIQLESADGAKTMSYMVNVRQLVSTYCKLKNITVGNTACVLTPPFQDNVTEYECTFWWEDTEKPEVIPTVDVDGPCEHCKIVTPLPTQFPESHLSLRYQEQIRREWKSGEVWSRKWLYGEWHKVPFQVYSQDRFTNTQYNVVLYRDCPWWMKVSTTRAISSTASTVAILMALGSAGNLMALAKQVQFMDLTTEIQGVPEVYAEFAANLKGFSFDITPYLPDMGLPTMQDVKDFRDKMIENLEDNMKLGGLKDSTTIMVQYCFAKATQGDIAANGILAEHPKQRKALFAGLQETSGGQLFRTPKPTTTTTTEEETEKEKKPTVVDDAPKESSSADDEEGDSEESDRRLQEYPELPVGSIGGFGEAQMSVSRLRGSNGSRYKEYPEQELVTRQLTEGGDWISDPLDGDYAPARRLGDDSALLVVEWTDHQWENFIAKAKKDGVTEDTYSDEPQVPCDQVPMSQVIPLMAFMHQLELVRRMMHTYTGTFLIMVFFLVVVGSSYMLYWEFVMKKSQRRLRILEPYFLWIFILDYALIGFTKSASKMVFKRCVVSFFIFKPTRLQIQVFCCVGIVVYPLCFTIFIVWLTYKATNGAIQRARAKAKGEEVSGLIFDPDQEQWTDPQARDMKITLEPPVPKFIPVLGNVLTSHVRHAIPVLTDQGDPIQFPSSGFQGDDDGQREAKKAALAQEEAEFDEELEKEIKNSAMGEQTGKLQEAKKERINAEKARRDQLIKRRKVHEAEEQKHWDALSEMENEIDVPWAEGEIECVNLGEFAKSCKSVKNREDDEILDPEEQFAMLQYLEGFMRREQRLLRYNILEIAPKNGHLVPKEPFYPEITVMENGVQTQKWCPTAQDLEKEDDAPFPKREHYGLDEYNDEEPYIENDIGQRLVYPGHQRSAFGWVKMGDLNNAAATLEWMSEPDIGWEAWEKSLAEDQNGMRYADKWQHVYSDYWDLPWSGDDESERQLNLGCTKIEKADFPFYTMVKNFLMSRYKTRVPHKIPRKEKCEIRKWIYNKLMSYMELKIKFGLCAAKNPKFWKPEDTLENIARKPFEQLLQEVISAQPSKERKPFVDREVHAHPGEYLDFTIMKLEDMHADGEEPWWEECDKPESGEYRAMFDHDMFYATGSGEDTQLGKLRKENPLVPVHGYFSSSTFMRFPNAQFGKKRYVLKKPDSSVCKLTLNFQMKHILPLMRYTKDFKVNVAWDSLELHYRSYLGTVLGDSGYGEEYNYVFDRVTTLLSIFVLASHPSGKTCACLFLVVRTVTFLNRWFSAYKSGQFADVMAADAEAEGETAPEEKVALVQKDFKGSIEGSARQTVSTKMPQSTGGHKKKKRPGSITEAFQEVEVTTLFLQVCTLALLTIGQFNGMPSPLCALACILVCSANMIYMNLATARKEIMRAIEDFQTNFTDLIKTARAVQFKAMQWLNGDNPLGIQFMKLDGAKGRGETAVNDVNICVPELGLTMQGHLAVDEFLPPDEQRKQKLLKTLSYYVHNPLPGDHRPSSVRSHPRYEGDIASSFTVTIDTDQLQMCKPIRPIVATLQCVNHSESSVSKPDFDTFKTLFLPEGWEDGENDKDDPDYQAAVNLLLKQWGTEIRQWFVEELGAVISERTLTKQIQEHVISLLGHPFKGVTGRTCFMFKIGRIMFPDFQKHTCMMEPKDLEGKRVFVTVLYETDDTVSEYPTSRMSCPAKLVRHEKGYPDEVKERVKRFNENLEAEGDLDERGEPPDQILERMSWIVEFENEKGENTSEFKVPIPPSVNKIKLMVWIQNSDPTKRSTKGADGEQDVWPAATDELLAFTEDFDLTIRHHEQLSEGLESHEVDLVDDSRHVIWTRWTQQLKKGLVPIEADDAPDPSDGCGTRCGRSFGKCMFGEITPEDVINAKGYIDIGVRKLTAEEMAFDDHVMLAMKDVSSGNSTLNREKMSRHGDRLLDLAEVLGLYVSPHAFKDVEEHIKKMKDFHQNEFGSSMEEPNPEKFSELIKKAHDFGLRRAFASPKESDRIIKKTEASLERLQAKYKALGDMLPVPHYGVTQRKHGRTVTRLDGDVDQHPRDFLGCILKELFAFKEEASASQTNILHYVMISDHLKPNKIWRPDAISPHVCAIVTNEFEDIKEVSLIGAEIETANKEGLPFKRMDVPELGTPETVNGRLAFKCAEPSLPGRWSGEKEIFLYWDGNGRWVISPQKGASAPYGGATADAAMEATFNKFIMVKDSAITPDKIGSVWQVWISGKWEHAPSIVVPRIFEEVVTLADKLKANANTMVEENDDDKPCYEKGLLGEIVRSIGFLFMSSSSQKMPAELKECLVYLSGQTVGFTWKDAQQEALAPFRKYLLSEFGSYQAAWVHLCRHKSVTKSDAITKLCLVMKTCHKELANIAEELKIIAEKVAQGKMQGETQELKEEKKEEAPPVEAIASTASNAEQKKKKKKLNKSKSLLSSLTGGEEGGGLFGGGLFGATKKKTNDLTKAAAEAATTGVEQKRILRDPMRTRDLSEEQRTALVKYLESVGVMGTHLEQNIDESKLEQECAYIFNYLDKNNDGGIPCEELMMLYSPTKSSDPKIKAFQDFLSMHPQYKTLEKLFCELSEGLQLNLEEFRDSAKSLLTRFDNMSKGGGEVKKAVDKADNLFQKLDVQMSKSVSYNEVVPISGPTAEDADRHLIQMKVPLAYIKEIRIEQSKKKDGAASLRFWVNPQFEMSPEWRCLKLGLNPEWEPNPGFETVTMAMLPEYLEMWKQVIRDCNMGQAQEWIRFYDGAIQDHAKLDGVSMRHGAGIQRWPTGQCYTGQWENHCYHGEGRLYERHQDMLEDLAPIYSGQWRRGKRNGEGVLRWEQDTSLRERTAHISDRQYAGVSKVYEGGFKDDCFHGRGKLYLERAVAQSLPGKHTSAATLPPGTIPYPILDAGSLLSFDGEFLADWKAADDKVRAANPLYAAANPIAEKELNLEKCNKREQLKQAPRFSKYFEVDVMKVQTAGSQLPDLAMALYQMRGGEALHLHNGKAKYADFSVYEGSFVGGHHNGIGKVTQYEVLEDGRRGQEMAIYEGQFEESMFHGEGTYTMFGPRGFTYKGQWERGRREGKGTQELNSAAAKILGYNKYEGLWHLDNFEGKGELSYGGAPVDAPEGYEDQAGGECTYKGEFNDGQREGKGKVYRKAKNGEEILVMHALFTDDKIDCTVEDAWCTLGVKEIRYFHGKITQDGNISVSGTMYGEHAGKKNEAGDYNFPEFMKCFEDGVPYDKESVQRPKSLRLIEYTGTWKDNKPHGYGVQHFEGDEETGDHHGTYFGDFHEGLRHGRGTWTTLKGTWMYRPIAAENVSNWENDLMHGIAIVEDRKNVHENVIYTQGKCQMPFTDLGPPKTGWEVGGIHELQPSVLKKRQAVKPYNTLYIPDSEAEKIAERMGIAKDGWDGYDHNEGMLTVKNALGMVALEENVNRKSKKILSAAIEDGHLLQAHELVDHDVTAMVREPTDLSMPEEDVIIAGGTGPNEIVNGVYFKLSSTFGVKAFKMVKMVSHGQLARATPIVRFLYKDTATSAWTISAKPLVGITVAPGCAFAHDESAEHPSLIKTDWYVWHPPTHGLQTKETARKEQEKKELVPKTTWETITSIMESVPPEPDILVCRSMVGFEMTVSTEKLGHVGRGLMLRIPTTLYGRPCYESESGGQFLYFLKEEGSLTEGLSGWEEFESGHIPDPNMFFAMKGHWIMAREMAMPKDKALAYCQDLAITPDLLEQSWSVRQLDDSWADVSDLKFRRQEWTHQSILEADTPSVQGEEAPLLSAVPGPDKPK